MLRSQPNFRHLLTENNSSSLPSVSTIVAVKLELAESVTIADC